MAPRAQLQSVLETICPNVYFQPPTNVQMVYPAIVYERRRGESYFSDNSLHCFTQQYQLMIISRDPDEIELHNAVIALPMCTDERFYVADNLNHDVFSIYF